MTRRTPISIANLICVIALAACSASPATIAAQKAAQRPITMQVEFFPMDEFSLWKKPASFTQDNTNEGTFPSKLGPVLIAMGYAKMFYQIGCWRSDFAWNKGEKQCDNWYLRHLFLTDAGKAAAWHCVSANDASKGTLCDVPIGSMQPSTAEIDDVMGSKVVKFDAIPVPNDIGKQLANAGALSTSWSSACGAYTEFAKKAVCAIGIGPDGEPEQ